MSTGCVPSTLQCPVCSRLKRTGNTGECLLIHLLWIRLRNDCSPEGEVPCSRSHSQGRSLHLSPSLEQDLTCPRVSEAKPGGDGSPTQGGSFLLWQMGPMTHATLHTAYRWRFPQPRPHAQHRPGNWTPGPPPFVPVKSTTPIPPGPRCPVVHSSFKGPG